MNQDGYTLAETLAALMMIGLAVGGLTAGVRVIGLNQTAAGRALAHGRELASLDRALARFFSGQGPFVSNRAGLTASADDLQFGCDGGAVCAASLRTDARGEYLTLTRGMHKQSLRLPKARVTRFSYVGEQSIVETWPPKTPDPQALRAVMLLSDAGSGEAPIATVRLWRAQPAICAFDPISRDCREAAP